MGRRYRVSPEEIARTRDVPLPAYLDSHGYVLKKDGRYYRLAEHDSLVIDPAKNRWHWNSQGIHNANTLDWLIVYEHMPLPDAVSCLLGLRTDVSAAQAAAKPISKEAKPLVFPERNRNHHRVYAYLTKTRGLDPTLVQSLLQEGLLYESAGTHNAVFVRLDNSGCPAGYFERGTLTYGMPYKHDPGGTDKRWTFLLSGRDDARLYICEAAIDVLSVETLRRRAGAPARQYSILSLAGNSTAALIPYLAAHPQTREFFICTDRDEGGNRAEEAIRILYGASYALFRRAPPAPCKDWNDVCTSGGDSAASILL